MRRSVCTTLIAIAVIFSMMITLVPATPAQAAALNVPANYPTINAAIAAAAAGDTINVAAGNYPENVVIDKGITLNGAPGATINPAAGHAVTITASTEATPTTVNGFNITPQDNTLNSALGIAISSVAGTSDITLSNNTISTLGDNHGIWIGGSSNGLLPANNLTVTGNNITVTGYATSLYAAHSTPAHANWTIANNAFNSPNGCNLELYDVDGATVDTNIFEVTAGSNVIISSELSDLTNLMLFSNNDIRGNDAGSMVAFITHFIVAGPTTMGAVQITGNIFDNWATRGLRIGAGVTVVNIRQNYFMFTGMGLANQNGVQIDAVNNWWGSASGPGPVGPGTGAGVSVDVLYQPWLTTVVPANAGTGIHDGKTVLFSTTNGVIENIVVRDITAFPSKPGNYDFPYGVYSFEITRIVPGSTVTITIKLPGNLPPNSKYYKFQNGKWVDVTSLMGSNNGDSIITLTLTDGGLGDADGVANGIIVDPGGPAHISLTVMTPPRSSGQTTTPATTTPVPLPNIAVQSASLSATTTTPDKPVTVTADISNTSTSDGDKQVILYVNGQVETTKGAIVNGGQSSQLTFTVSRSEPGTYDISVDNVPAGSFKVELTSASDNILIISMILVVVAFSIALIAFVRRHRTSYR
ncbi:MAG: hypothetical protein JW901_02210 [Dehalococcoidia bacterium]|nr:hypothetical protein [Dehalococcoidia bacterium]